MRIAHLAWIFFLTLPAHALDRTPFVRAKIESVEGAKTVLLQKGLALRDASPGDDIQVGERIRTDSKTTVTVAYADGSTLVIHPGSDLEIDRPEKGVQSNQLRAGLVQGIVPKVESALRPEEMTGGPAGQPPREAPKKPIRFIIRTKSAVMGVRGTEFVVGFDAVQGLAQFNTIEGTVEVATSAGELGSGQGVAVAAGQVVQATPEGLSAVSAFEVPGFVENLGGLSRTMGFAGSGENSGANSAQNPEAVAQARPPAPVPPAAPPPKLPQAPPPPPLTPAAAEKQRVEVEREKPKIHLLAFSFGGFAATIPQKGNSGSNQTTDPANATPNTQATTEQTQTGGKKDYRALEIAWTPTIPIPVLNFLYVRGVLGAVMFNGFSLNNSFLMHEYLVFAGTTLLNPIFVEVGGGEQIWKSENIDAGMVGLRAGIIFNQNGFFNRVYAGVSKSFAATSPTEGHLGVGLQIF